MADVVRQFDKTNGLSDDYFSTRRKGRRDLNFLLQEQASSYHVEKEEG